MTSTTDTDTEEVFLKTDRLGRVHMPADKRELILDRFESSGLSGQAFAAQIGVKYPTFANWVQRRRRAQGGYTNPAREPAKAPVALLEAIVDAPEHRFTQSRGLTVETTSGLKLHLGDGGDIAQMVALVKALSDAKL